MFETETCGCGKPVRYQTRTGSACNKYFRCASPDEWRVSEFGIFRGTLRIARFDFDTNPSEEIKQEIYDTIRNALNLPAAICSCGDHCQTDGAKCWNCVANLENELAAALAPEVEIDYSDVEARAHFQLPEGINWQPAEDKQ